MENLDDYTLVFTSRWRLWKEKWLRRVQEYVLALFLTAIVAAFLFPVFAQVHEGHHISCLSNQRQIGLGMRMYAQDYDENFPCGTRGDHQGDALIKDTPRQARYHGGQGWAGTVYPYVKTVYVFRCPQETQDSRSMPQNTVGEAYPVSYAYNRNVAEHHATGALNTPEVTVLLAEVEGAQAHFRMVKEYALEGRPDERMYSPAGNGLSLLAATDNTHSPDVSAHVRYVTGILGGYGQTPACPLYHYSAPYAALPRHTNGANYVLADGHVKYFEPQSVSPGENALSGGDSQDCTLRRAAGTHHLDPFLITFSTK